MALGKVCLAADVSVVAMTPDLGAEIRGVDLAAPLSDACFARIREVLRRYCMVFLRNQELDTRLFARFASRFGEAELTPSDELAVPGLPQVGVVGDPERDEAALPTLREAARWHTDRSFEHAPPAITLLYRPGGGDGATVEFVNMCSVFDALPAEKRLRVQKLRAVHARPAAAGSPGVPDAEHPLVRVHPETGKRALYLAKDVMLRVPGLGDDESRKLFEELEAFATQPRFVYTHRWRRGDLLVWDNRSTLHRMPSLGTGRDRPLYRIRVKGEVPAAG